MKNKHLFGIQTTVISAAIILMLATTGCQSSLPESSAEPTPLTYKSTPPPTKELDSPQKTYNDTEQAPVQSKTPEMKIESEEEQTSPLVNKSSKEPDNEKSSLAANVPQEGKTPAVTPKSQVQSLSNDNLTLHDLAIGAHIDQLKPYKSDLISHYPLGEGKDAIEVYDYDGFSVGINQQSKIQFIEVFGENVSTGLNGILIGDSPAAVIEALGNPHKQTDYVLNYKFTKTLLKFDLDPKNNTIISVKLLSSK